MAAQYYILPDNVKLEEVQLVNAQDVQFGTQQFVLAPDQNLGNMQIVYQSTEEPQNNAPPMISPQNFTQRRWILTEEGTLQPQVVYATQEQIQVQQQIQQQQQPGISQEQQQQLLETVNPQTMIIQQNPIVSDHLQLAPSQMQQTQQIILHNSMTPQEQQATQMIEQLKQRPMYTYANVNGQIQAAQIHPQIRARLLCTPQNQPQRMTNPNNIIYTAPRTLTNIRMRPTIRVPFRGPRTLTVTTRSIVPPRTRLPVPQVKLTGMQQRQILITASDPPPVVRQVEERKMIPSPTETDDIEKNITAAILQVASGTQNSGPLLNQSNEGERSSMIIRQPNPGALSVLKRGVGGLNRGGGRVGLLNSRFPVPPPPQQQTVVHQPLQQPPQQQDMGHHQLINKRNDQTMNQVEPQSAKMLVILPNSEHRLITFTLPNERCTVQELLEQVGVKLTPNTQVRCESHTGSDINYVVTVEERPLIVNRKPAQASSADEQANKILLPPAKRIEGFLAVCINCGYTGNDFAKCERCFKIFIVEPKRIQIPKPPKPVNQNSPQKMFTMKIGHSIVGSGGRRLLTSTPLLSTSGRGRGTRPVGRPKIVIEPPVVLTLSSDEEEETPPPSKQNKTLATPTQPPLPKLVLSCEPKPSCFDEKAIVEDSERLDVCTDDSNPDFIQTAVDCSLIRIGSYPFHANSIVVFTSKGLKILVPNCENGTKMETLNIQLREIVKVIVHYGKNFPVIFIYTTPNCSRFIRKTLNMSPIYVPNASNKCLYFDPVHMADHVKRIVLSARIIRDETKEAIKSIFPLSNYDEISHKDAVELFNQSRGPNEELGKRTMLTRAVDKQQQSLQQSQSLQSSQSDGIHKIFIYPKGKGGISINTEDYMCLATDQYLNDVIIDFYLKYVFLEKMSPEQRSKTHIFSSFFYKRLTATSARQRLIEKDLKMTPAQKRHNRVKSWTKNVNLFDKEFIVIPINELSHWFLAIICFPGLKQPHTMTDNRPINLISIQEKRKRAKAAKAHSNAQTPQLKKQVSLTIGNTTITPVNKKEDGNLYLNEDSMSERDEAEGDESDMTSEDEELEAVETPAKKSLIPIKQPSILIFDSLAGNYRSRVVATLRDYLSCEYNLRMKDDNQPMTFDKETMPGHNVKVPQQNNFTDCGLFVLQYVEELFENPLQDFRLPIRTLKKWFDTNKVTRKREDIGNLLKEFVGKEHPERLELLPDINFPTLNGVVLEQEEEPAEEENAEEEEDCFEEPENELPVETDAESENGGGQQMDVVEGTPDKSAVKRKKTLNIPTTNPKKSARIL